MRTPKAASAETVSIRLRKVFPEVDFDLLSKDHNTREQWNALERRFVSFLEATKH